jgi:putative NADH-flavin reductase
MDLAVIGATGRTGRLVVETALARGHRLSLLVRDPARLSPEITHRTRVVTGDASDPQAAEQLLAGTEAVLSALGPTAKEGDLHTRTARTLVSIMRGSGPRRFVGISGAGIDVPGDQKAVRDKIISKSIQLLGGSVVKDKPAEYAVWAASDLDWTLIRPPRLVDGPATGSIEHHAHRSTASTTISRADLAAFLLEVVEQGLYLRQAPFVAGR